MNRLVGVLTVISLSVLGAANPAAAQKAPAQNQNMPMQGFDLTGAWSGEFQTSSGEVFSTTVYNSDGSFINISRPSNGVTLRVTGVYQVTVIGKNQMSVRFLPRTQQPSKICTVSSTGDRDCKPMPAPPEITSHVTMVSAAVMKGDSVAPGQPPFSFTVHRDSNPHLLNIHFSDEQVIEGNRAP